MNKGYINIFIVAFILLIISIYYETNNTQYLNMNPPTTNQYIYIYLIRYYHYLIYLFSSFYLLFFQGIGSEFDRYFYLFVTLCIPIGWYIFDSCWLSFLELLFYKIDLEHIKISYHPTFHSIFYNFYNASWIISAIFALITPPILLYFSKTIPFIIKLIYYSLFMFLSIDSLYKSRKKTLYYDSKKNKQLAYVKSIYEKIFKKK